MSRQIIHTESAPAAIGPYVQAVKLNGFVYTSGQLGLDPATGMLPEGIEAQTHASMKNIGAILAASGLGYSNIVKTTIFVKDLKDFATVNKIYESYLASPFPARSCVEVARLPKDGLVEIECIAAE